jgi:hypothetical protein
MSAFIFMSLFFIASFGFAQNVAVVKVLKGEANVLTVGKTIKLNINDWVKSGDVVKTAEKSFVKLIFIDKSQMNIGPNSEMKIAKYQGDEAGVIDLVKGKIRSQVTKDYLQNGKSKLLIKTPNAVMGIRGTDFLISTNGKTTSAVLFEGTVVFNKLETAGNLSNTRLEEIVDRGVRVAPGEFSVVDKERSIPTMPARLNIQQLEVLEKNQSFDSERTPSNAVNEVSKSVVPDGLSGQQVSNSVETLKNEVAQIAPDDKKEITRPEEKSLPQTGAAEGFVDGEKVKPANGSFVHIDSGVIIPPGADSVLDENSNTYIPSTNAGKVGSDGNYVPPKNVEITDDGKILVAVEDKKGQFKVQEIEKPVPILANSVVISKVSEVIRNNPELINPSKMIKNDILSSTFVPSGLNDVSNLQRNSSGSVQDVTNAVQMNNGPRMRTITVEP